MNIAIALSLVTLALQLGAFVAAFAMARAPGWRRVRIVSALACTAGLYSLNDLLGFLYMNTEISIAWVTSANLVVAAAHVSAWLWYSYADEQGSFGRLPRWVRRLAIGNVLVALSVSLTGHAITHASLDRVSVPSLGVEFSQPELSVYGSIASALILTVLAVSLVEQIRQARRGVQGAKSIVGGFVFFMLCGLEEVFVASGLLDFLYLAEVGYLGLVVPVTAQLLDRFVGDARRLAELSKHLSEEVQVATHERDAAREALAVQERFAALGRIAGGVGHEVNNPLQYLSLNLEELRDLHLAEADAATTEALAQAFDATERIRRIVEGLRSYAQTSSPRLERLDLQSIVRSAVRATEEQLPGAPEVRVRFLPAPAVFGDEAKLVQAIVNALENAAIALASAGTVGARVEVRTRTSSAGDAVLEVCDNGPGFPAELFPRLGEPFVTTRATAGGSGLGIFVTRGIVDAHRGMLELENARDGGAVMRIILPPARN